MKTIFVAASVAFAFEDDGLSLLQLRHQKSESSPQEEAEDIKVTVQAGNTLCKPEEVLTFAQCVTVQRKHIVPNPHQHWSLISPQRGHGVRPTGCAKNTISGVISFNDEPETSRGHPRDMPICSPSGGRATEIANGLTGRCDQPNCVPSPPVSHQKMLWGPELFVPEFELLPSGSVCACGLLNFMQCQKAGDNGLVEAITGKRVPHMAGLSLTGPAHTIGQQPSGCMAQVGTAAQGSLTWLQYSPMDTIDGAGAGLTTPSGVGVGWGHPGLHAVCPVCTTTTTTTTNELPDDEESDEEFEAEAEAEAVAAGGDEGEDEAGAVGDPHIHSSTGKDFDLENSPSPRHDKRHAHKK